jgi:flagellar basal-body rod protein FlgG
MLEGMYSAAAGMAAQQQRLDALSNDIANVDTVGYKGVRVAFRDLVYDASGPGGAPGAVLEGAGAEATTIGRSGAAAPLEQTGRALDVAIGGDGYLQVTRPDGTTALTRDGHLSVDAGGRVLAAGLPLQPPVTLPAGTDPDSLSIAADGTLTSQGRRVGGIQLLTVRAPDRMMPVGDNLFAPTAQSGAPGAARAATLQQGVLEGSNVDLANTMVDMMDAQRSYSLAARAINYQDQMAQIANGLKR